MTIAAIVVGIASLVCAVWFAAVLRRCRRRARIAKMFDPSVFHAQRIKRRR